MRGRYALVASIIAVAVGASLAFPTLTAPPDLTSPSTAPPPVQESRNPTPGAAPLDQRSFDPRARDRFPALHNPAFVPAEQSEWPGTMHVVGVLVGEEARAYPLAVIAYHHIVNDVIAGRAVLVTYCGLCGTGIVYNRTVNGRPLTFGVAGLYRRDLVMYDRETESHWVQLWGRAIDGPLSGTRLPLLSSTTTTLAEWRSAHPSTLVLRTPTEYKRRYAGDPLTRTGEEFVLGVLVNGLVRAYPYTRLETTPVVNDVIGDQPIVIAYDSVSRTAVAYHRSVAGRVHTFELAPPGVLVDSETQTRWSLVSGRAIGGPLTGQQLEEVASIVAFLRAWQDFFPESTYYG